MTVRQSQKGRMLTEMAGDSLTLWAMRRAGTVADSGRPWRGTQLWGPDYDELTRRWQSEGRKGLPPAFRDGQARPKQLAPGTPGSWSSQLDWLVWFIMSGRGFGKTRSGAEFVRDRVTGKDGLGPPARRIALVAPTASSARDIIVEDPLSGLLAICPPSERPEFEPSKRRLTFPNGAVATLYSAEEPGRLRGPQHDTFWADELATWQYLEEAWDNLMLGFRIGVPRGVVTTTPRPLKKLKEILALDSTIMVRGSSWENEANLAPQYVATVIQPYVGTRKGRQELDAEILEDVEGALWTLKLLDACRWTQERFLEYEAGVPRKLAGIDPSGGVAETGIVIGGRGGEVLPVEGQGRRDWHGFVLADATVDEDEPGAGTPARWAERAVAAYHEHGLARLIAEDNHGGAMVEDVLRSRDPNVALKRVHASDGKRTRAEPVSAMFEQLRIHPVGHFPKLEDELVNWVPGMASPNRLDAMVWMLTEAMLGKVPPDFSGLGSALAAHQQTGPSTWRRT